VAAQAAYLEKKEPGWMKVAELRMALRALGMDSDGKRKELIARLANHRAGHGATAKEANELVIEPLDWDDVVDGGDDLPPDESL
jgi:hypothetical protein